MQKLRYSCASVVLTLLIDLATVAGEMGFPVGPPNDPNSQTQAQMAASLPEYGDALTAFATSVLQSVLTLF